jgi:hypothetical protein
LRGISLRFHPHPHPLPSREREFKNNPPSPGGRELEGGGDKVKSKISKGKMTSQKSKTRDGSSSLPI